MWNKAIDRYLRENLCAEIDFYDRHKIRYKLYVKEHEILVFLFRRTKMTNQVLIDGVFSHHDVSQPELLKILEEL